MKSRLFGVLFALGVATGAYAQVPNTSGRGEAYPGSESSGGAVSSSAASGEAGSSLNSPRALPPLTAQDRQNESNFEAAVATTSPLTPEQIKMLRKRVDAAAKASSTPPTVPPKPVYSALTVDLSPGSTPPIVRVSSSGAAVNFMDSTGAPWPIIEVDNMAKGRFEVLKPVPDVQAITVTALGSYVEGNVAVFLKDLPVPVVLKMVAGQRETDYRLDLTIPRRGPQAAPTITGPAAISLPSGTLQNVLDGIDITGTTPLKLENAPAGMQAWKYGDHMLLRTSLFLNNPAWYSSQSSADGTTVYEIPLTPAFTVSDGGTKRTVLVELE